MPLDPMRESIAARVNHAKTLIEGPANLFWKLASYGADLKSVNTG